MPDPFSRESGPLNRRGLRRRDVAHDLIAHSTTSRRARPRTQYPPERSAHIEGNRPGLLAAAGALLPHREQGLPRILRLACDALDALPQPASSCDSFLSNFSHAVASLTSRSSFFEEARIVAGPGRQPSTIEFERLASRRSAERCPLTNRTAPGNGPNVSSQDIDSMSRWFVGSWRSRSG